MVVGAVLLADGLDEGARLAQVVARQAREEMVLHLARGRGRARGLGLGLGLGLGFGFGFGSD